jgi:uncharacterized protein (TIGR02679 family)
VTATVDRARVERLLGGPELAWLVERMRRRLTQGRPLRGAVIRAGASPGEREAVARLLGRRLRAGDSVTVSLDDVERVVVRAGVAPDLRAAVEALVGAVADEAARRAASDAAWARVVEEARVWTAPAGLDGWLDEVARSGLLRRQAGGDVTEARRLLDAVAAVVARLPAAGVPRARLAAEALGSAKALDASTPVTALVLRAAAVLAGVAERGEGQTATAWRREVWASVGVLSGELAAPALTLGLPGDPASVAGRLLDLCREAGEPVHVTLRQLVADPPRWSLHGTRVFVCENPSVVAVAAAELGTACAPLVCTGGQPSAAVATLLRRLVEGGASLAYHGDFDWPGIRIANGVLRRWDAAPWRMAAVDYTAAASRSRRPLEGDPVDASWDAALAAAMEAFGVRVEEELVVDRLVADLSD